MDDWQTNSPLRLRYRKVIRGVIDDWVHGPVELLVGSDLRLIKKKIRAEWGGAKQGGWDYVNWLAEVNLALGVRGDPLKALKDKAPKKRVDLRGVTPEQAEWFASQESGSSAVQPKEQAESLGVLFES